ncbi:MAG: hypothetical protein R3C20_20355 [Planctomycetaceae bacterium]
MSIDDPKNKNLNHGSTASARRVSPEIRERCSAAGELDDDGQKSISRMIQRCVDDELTSAETREMMSRLESVPQGWKTLACGFLEDRLFQHAIRGRKPPESSTDPGARLSGLILSRDASGQRNLPNLSPSRPAESNNHSNVDAGGSVDATGGISTFPSQSRLRQTARHWWSHPIVSLSLCGAIAFVTGLLVPDFAGQGSRQVANRDTGNLKSATIPGISQSGQLVGEGSLSSQPGYTMKWVPGEDGQGVELPIVNDPREWGRGFLAPRSSQDVPINGSASSGGDSYQLIRIPGDDQKDILFIVPDGNISRRVQ